MNLNYAIPAVPARWADSRETHPAVATAIHAIADKTRSPEAIWEAPTPAEWQHVAMAVEQYVTAGLFERMGEEGYSWGEETLLLPGESPR